jgi:protease IV
MDQSAIADRRSLRRKLGFWRLVAAALILIGGFSAYFMTNGERLGSAPQVARVSVTGLITDDEELLARLARIEESDAVKALVVSISSNGGTTYGGEKVYKALRRIAAVKPVVSDIRTTAASAAYMIAVAGDRIFAGETSITGSIGVIFQYPQVKDLLDKIGVSLEEIKSAPLKAEPSPFHPPSEDAKGVVRDLVLDSYDWFVDLVAERRGFTHDEAVSLADGRIYSGRQALKLKLVDELGGDEEIRTYLETRGVSSDLPLIDWQASEGISGFTLPRALSTLINLLGYGDLAGRDKLSAGAGEHLLVDGLTSYWRP